MTTTIEALEQRVAALEKQLCELCPLDGGANSTETPEQFLARIMTEARHDKMLLQPHLAELRHKLGVGDTPVPVEQLEELWLQAGIKPEECVLSRGIQGMREE
jgi:hypothetical protein